LTAAVDARRIDAMFAGLLRLDSKSRRLLFRATGWVVAARIGLWLVPFQTLRRLFRRMARTVSAPAPPIERVVWAVLTASRRMPGPQCLCRSLALELMLRQARQPCELVIGVRKRDADAIWAHAWVTIANRPVLDEDLSAYSPLLVLAE
jgi:hypothetical protein